MSLADRLRSSRSEADLSEHCISFEEAKLKQKYIDVVTEDPKYVKWFVEKYSKSEKSSHKSFLFFVNMYVERLELSQGKCSPETLTGSPRHLHLQAKAKCAPRPNSPPSEVGSWSDEGLIKPR